MSPSLCFSKVNNQVLLHFWLMKSKLEYYKAPNFYTVISLSHREQL